MSEKIYTKEIPSNPEFLPEVEEFIIEIAQENKLDDDKFNNLALSVAEAASNSIVHGNKSDKDKLLHIKVKIDEEKIKIIFKDEGDGFNPQKVPDPTKPENILKDNGRGIHIMKTFLDDLTYNFTENGTETILTLNR